MSSDLVGNRLFEDFHAVLRKHLRSNILADSVVKRVIEKERINPRELSKKDLEKVYQNIIFVSIRLFCRKRELTEAMLELAELMED